MKKHIVIDKIKPDYKGRSKEGQRKPPHRAIGECEGREGLLPIQISKPKEPK